jgi:hypothetical protein
MMLQYDDQASMPPAPYGDDEVRSSIVFFSAPSLDSLPGELGVLLRLMKPRPLIRVLMRGKGRGWLKSDLNNKLKKTFLFQP